MSDDSTEQLDRIQAALTSSKVDSYMLLEFEELRQSMPAAELPNRKVAFLALIKANAPKLNGELGRIGNIASIQIAYSAIPDFVRDSNVIKIEASRSSFVF